MPTIATKSGPRWVLAASWLLALQDTNSFQVMPVVPSKKPSSLPTSRQLQGMDSLSANLQRRPQPAKRQYKRTTWLESNVDSSEATNNEEGTDSSSGTGDAAYDGLYEFLTRRTGEQAGDTERRRKRDRIRDWMSSSSESSSGSNMIQPIRMEDGSVMEDAPKSSARLERLLSGMPSLDDILSNDGSIPSDDASPARTSSRPSSDDSWFEAEKNRIEGEYQQILRDMKAKIEEQRRTDPDAIPDNAEGVAESVVQQELQRMLKSVKTARSKERLQEYESSQKADLETKDMQGVTDEVVDRILQESADEWKRQDKVRAEVDDFARYEQEAVNSIYTPQELPAPGSDLDAWALQRLEDMQEQSQDNMAVTDILDQQIEDLKGQIERESRKGSIEPQTMKEWQMYRAIATRLRRERDGESPVDPALNMDNASEENIAKQLNSWREYVGMEEEIRKRAGLAVGPRMPFEWQEARSSNPLQEDVRIPSDSQETKGRTRQEIRREVNLQAIKALETLVAKSDSIRAENLQTQLDALRAELEPRDYNDIEEEIFEETLSGPVDLTGVFGDREENKEETTLPSSLYKEQRLVIDQMLSSDGSVPYQQAVGVSTASKPPNPPFFGNTNVNVETPQTPNTPFFAEQDEEPFAANVAPPPDSPFFSDSSLEQEGEEEQIDVQNTKLGSVEDQKLMNMYRKAGARTKQEQDNIREQWEAFQALEKTKREESGLSESADVSVLEADLKYNVTDVMNSDGDFDAQKILSAIGPRPSRRKSASPVSTSEEADAVPTSDLDPVEVSESLYRTVSAVGGGRTRDDPVARKEEKAEFEDFLQKENELRDSLDQLDDDVAQVVSDANAASMDTEAYAEDALASLKPRPTIKKRVPATIDEKEFSDRGGVLSHENIDADDSDSGEDDPNAMNDDAIGLVPDWLQKERETIRKKEGFESSSGGLSGRDIDQVFDDDEYDRNLRQLHEYEQRRSGNQKQMGIDISDVLGRRAGGSDDYADYSFDSSYFRGRDENWGAVNFQARKANLLEYTELTPIELNNLMDHRDSVSSNGASQYMPRINKPFKEFGAIFRLEGVIFDLSGLHTKVWAKVADDHGFRMPNEEEISHAAVVQPDVAVRDVFYWTNDMFAVREIVASFQILFAEKFSAWATENGLENHQPSKSSESKGSMALGAEEIAAEPILPSSPVSPPAEDMREDARLRKLQESWTTTARELELSEPTVEQIVQSSFLASEIAVRDVFRWTSDRQEMDAVVSVFNAIHSGQTGNFNNFGQKERAPGAIDQERMIEYQYQAWCQLAQEESFETPSPEEAFAAAVLNDPEMVIMKGFGWTDDREHAKALASRYLQYLAPLVGKSPNTASTPQESPREVVPQTASKGPTASEVLESQIEAWGVTGAAHGFTPPPVEQIELTMSLGAEDSVRRLLGWTSNFNEDQIAEVANTYSEALGRASEKYVKAYGIQVPKKAPQSSQAVTTSSLSTLTQDQLFQAAFDAWTNVSWKSGFSMPDQEQVIFAISVGPEEAIITGFGWTDNIETAATIADEYREQIRLKRLEWAKQGFNLQADASGNNQDQEDKPPVVIAPGVVEWIRSLRDVEMGCGIVSHLEQSQVDVLLEYAGLSNLISVENRVSATSGYDRDNQQLLGVALRIERRPDHCVAFDTSPIANMAAHEVEMRSVSMVGPYPRYELLSADSSAVSFSELTAMNIRRLFGERVYDQPMLDMMQNQPEVARKTKTAFWDDE